MLNFASIRRWTSVALMSILAGCTVHPPGEREERASALQSGRAFEKRIDLRDIAPLPDGPSPDQLVEYSFLTNAELEQHYWEWRSAIEQIPQDGSQTTTLNVAAGTTITKGHSDLRGSTLTLANDPMTDIKWPGKLDAAARQTLENARAAGLRFLKSKYGLRSKVLGAYYDYALTAELVRLEQSNEQLLEATVTSTTARNRAGTAGQQDVMKSSNEVDMSRNDIATMQSQLMSERAAINALLNRSVDAPLPVPANLPAPRSIAYVDGELLDLAAQHNPELIALADEIRGRQEGIRLAKLQYMPDFNLSAGTDLMGIAQSVLGQATIPILRYEAINASVAQAEANLRASEAMRRQNGSDLGAEVVSDITTIRDADRQLDLLQHTILPRARQIVTIGRSSYESGHASLLDLLDNQRSLIAIERLLAGLNAAREKHLVDLEAITTVDLSNHETKQAVTEEH